MLNFSVNLFFIVWMCFFLVGCVKDKPVIIKENTQIFSGESGKVFVLNEGNFGSGNGSVSLYDPITGGVTEDYFQQQNQQSAGDVVQSMTKLNGLYYLVVNNSGKIFCLNKGFKIQQTLSGLNSPRYIIPLANDKALVSDLYANALTVFNPNTMQIIQQIPLSGWTERMEKYQSKVFITNPKRNYLYVLNIYSLSITDSIPLHKGGNSLLIDRYNKLWVLCSGDIMSAQAGALFKINPDNHQVEWSSLFTSGHPNNLNINPTRDTLYFLHTGGIYRMSVNSTSLPQGAWISSGTKNFYGMRVNPASGNIYVADAKDYIQKSDIYIFKSNGQVIGNFKAGIISGDFCFE
jgi:hypothetical protein